MMRHKLLPLSSIRAAILAAAVLSVLSPAFGTPVYLKPESRFPSGHHPRKWLEGRTRDVQFQRWLRVKTRDQAYGWLPEDHLLTPLKLATEAVLTEDVPARSETRMDSLNAKTLSKGTRLVILEVSGSWVRAQPLPASSHAPAWIPSESLKADLEAKAPRAFSIARTSIFVLPGLHARVTDSLGPGTFLEVFRQTREWIEIRHRGAPGFVRRSDVVTLADLGEKGVRPLFSHAALRSAPLPYADLVRSLPHSTNLTVIDSQTLRWGAVQIPKIGKVWWPISEDFEDDKALPSLAASPMKILTPDLFSRKLFDMASSPAIPSLKFASAEGVFRTTDGQEWTKIPLFQNQNYPIAIAGSGPVFIGPYVSDDHGETFQQWIRWDSLVATLKNRHVMAPRGLQILEITPQDATGRRITLTLHIGLKQPVKVITDDQGLSWRAL